MHSVRNLAAELYQQLVGVAAHRNDSAGHLAAAADVLTGEDVFILEVQ